MALPPRSLTQVGSQNVERARNADLPFRGPFFSRVVDSAGSERVKTRSIVGERTTPFVYAFSSARSWIRGQPATGTTMLSTINSEDNKLTPIAYYDPVKADVALSYAQVADAVRADPIGVQIPSMLAYRNLASDELDLASGYAQQFMGRTDLYSVRGGLSTFKMTSANSKLSTVCEMVTGPHHVAQSSLNDERRFGVVYRVTSPTVPVTRPRPVKVNGHFAKENTFVVSWKGLPGKLAEQRVGIVVDDNGRQVRDPVTGFALRSERSFYAQGGVSRENVDEQGNCSWSGSATAQVGGQVSWPSGGQRFIVGKTFDVVAQDDIRWVTTRNLNALAQESWTLTAVQEANILGVQAVNINSTGNVNVKTPAQIRLGIAPIHPVMVASPAYLGSLQAMLAAVSAAMTAAAAADTTLAATLATLAIALPPAAAAVAPSAGTLGAAAAAQGAVVGAISAHVATLIPAPVGCISIRTVSE